jgi:hypothetical protein
MQILGRHEERQSVEALPRLRSRTCAGVRSAAPLLLAQVGLQQARLVQHAHAGLERACKRAVPGSGGWGSDLQGSVTPGLNGLAWGRNFKALQL